MSNYTVLTVGYGARWAVRVAGSTGHGRYGAVRPSYRFNRMVEAGAGLSRVAAGRLARQLLGEDGVQATWVFDAEGVSRAHYTTPDYNSKLWVDAEEWEASEAQAEEAEARADAAYDAWKNA